MLTAPEIEEVEINSLVAHATGEDVTVFDAFVVTSISAQNAEQRVLRQAAALSAVSLIATPHV